MLDMLAFMAASPVIHAVHDDRMGGYSAAMHIGGPLAGVCIGALVGLAFPSCSCSSSDLICLCGFSGMGVGAFAGTVAGMSIVALVDAFVFGWNPPLGHPDPPQASWIFAPTTMRGGAAVSVGRTF